jgi:hypothetical protein
MFILGFCMLFPVAGNSPFCLINIVNASSVLPEKILKGRVFLKSLTEQRLSFTAKNHLQWVLEGLMSTTISYRPW